MLLSFKKLSSIDLILALRACSIVIQLSLVLFVNLVLGYALPWLPLLIIILVEVFFNGTSYLLYKNQSSSKSRDIFFQLFADILFLGALLYFSGGATNAFVSLLLIPIAIGAVALQISGVISLALAAVGIYSLLLWLMPMHVMHGNMEGHFIGMWLNFLFSSVVVCVVVMQMARTLKVKEQTIAKFREEQLKQERVMALGVASAQVSHDVATPIASIQLLVDEMEEEGLCTDQELLAQLKGQAEKCGEKLATFRETAEDIRSNKESIKSCTDIFNQLKNYSQLYYPAIAFDFSDTMHEGKISADSALIPAILNIINNAVKASEQMHSNQVKISSNIDKANSVWIVSILDYGKGFTPEQFATLGTEVYDSEQGMGIALLLSNASLERHQGKLIISNHQTHGAEVVIKLPLMNSSNEADNTVG